MYNAKCIMHNAQCTWGGSLPHLQASQHVLFPPVFLLQAQNTNKVMKRWPIPPVVYEGPTTVPLAPVLALLSPRTHLLVREGSPGVGNGEALQIRKRKILYKQV